MPPNRWFHQHFNVGGGAGRYLALHPAGQNRNSERVQDPPADQIEYPNEEPVIRDYFESQLSQGLESKMPAQAYAGRNFEWDYGNSQD